MQPVEVRMVLPQDREQWQTLWDGYNAFYGRHGATALAPAISDSTWSRLLDEREQVYGLVAHAGGQLLGLAHYLFHRNTLVIGPACYLQDLFTLESARGRGVGRALIEEVARQARDASAERLYWHTHHTNTSARRLYDSVAVDSGFIVYRKAL